MAHNPTEVVENLPPVAHARIVYVGPTAPHWEVHSDFGDGRLIDEFRTRAMARLLLLPPFDPQFRRNRERCVRDAERERILLEWDLGYPEEGEPAAAPPPVTVAPAPVASGTAADQTGDDTAADQTASSAAADQTADGTADVAPAPPSAESPEDDAPAG